MFSVRVQLSPKYVLASGVERVPELVPYVTTPAACRRVAGAGQHVYDLTIDHDVHLPTRAFLGIDLYTSVQNDRRAQCRVHSAYDTLDLYRLFHAPPGATFTARLHNRSASKGASKGVVGVHVLATGNNAAGKVPVSSEPLTPLRENMRACMERGIATLARVPASRPRLAHILAPTWKTRLGLDLPGVAYWMVGADVDESCATQMLDVVLARRPRGAIPFEDLPVREAAPLLASWTMALPCSLPYVADKYPDERVGALVPFEQFDDLFVRRAGDCEDCARAVCALFNAARFGHWQTPRMQRLQEIARHYIAVGVLGTVKQYGAEAAHMHAELHPVNEFAARAGVVCAGQPTCAGLPVLLCDATTRLCPVFDDAVEASEGAVRVAHSVPAGYDVERKQCWGGNALYHTNIHAYTDYFMRLHREQQRVCASPAFFSFLGADGRSYGAAAGDTSSRFFAHYEYTPAEKVQMRTAIAYNTPTAALRTSAESSARSVAYVDRIGKRYGAVELVGGSGCKDALTVFCTTTDESSRRLFTRAADRHGYNVQSTTAEYFADFFPPQLRIDLISKKNMA